MSQRRRLAVLLGLNLAMIVVLVAVGVATGSLGVLAAGGDYLADSIAIALGILAVTLRDRGRSPQATTYVGGINAGALLVITCLVIAEAVHRLLTQTPEIRGLPVLLVAALSSAVMLLGAVVLGRDAGSEDVHMRSVMIDTLADAATSAAVAVSGAIILISGGWYWLDSAVALGIGIVVAVWAIRLLVDVARALKTHTELDLDDD